MIKYNKLNTTFNYDLIADRYRVYKFSADNLFIRYGALILDLIESSLSAKSVVFETGNIFYALFDQSVDLYKLRADMSHVEQAEGLEVHDETKDIQSLPENILLQLLLNTLTNSNHELLQYNNLSGHLYLIAPENLQCWKKADNLIIKIPALRVRVSEEMGLNLDVTTFTNLTLQNRLKFKKKKLPEYARYTFLPSKLTMRRILPSEKISKANTYIIKQEPNKKSVIPFFNFESKDAFDRSKLGHLYDFWLKVKSDLSDVLKIEFETLTKVDSLSFSKKQSELKANQISSLINKNSVNIIDTISDEDSRDFLDDFKTSLTEIFPEISISNGKKVEVDALNLRLVHNKEYYLKYDLVDSYDSFAEAIVQHLTLEDFNFSASAAVRNVLKELTIKADIQKHQISLFDWTSLDFDSDWTFVTKESDLFHFLTITPTGWMEFESYQPELLASHSFDHLIEIYDQEGNGRLEGLVLSHEGYINTIERTENFTIPDFETVGNELKLATRVIAMRSSELSGYLDAFGKETDLTDKQRGIIEEYKNRFSIMDSELDRSLVLSIIKDRTLRKTFSSWLFEKTGILLHYYFRDQRRYELFNSNLDIKYWKDKNESYLHYCVGEKGEGIQANFPKSSTIRRIRAYGSNKLFFDQLIPTMNVDFVKNEALTAIPFPFKYLREYYNTSKNV